MHDENGYHKYHGIFLLANLAPVDSHGKFERVFDAYLRLMEDKRFVLAINLVNNLGKVARAKPALQGRITDILLHLDKTRHKHKDLLKSGAVLSFGEYFGASREKDRILKFVRGLLKARSPKARKVAKDFLARHGP